MAAPLSLDQLLDNVQALANYQFENAADKRRAMLALRAASDKLQHPFDKILEMWGATARDSAVKVAIDVDLFKKWDEVGKSQTAAQLAELTGVQEDLMKALLRHMASCHIIEEEGPNTYSQTEYSRELGRPEIAACVDLHFDAILPVFPKLPVYLKATNYVRPTNHKWAPLSYAMNFNGDFFEYQAQNIHCGQSLDMAMKGYAAYRGDWTDVFPGELLFHGTEPDQTLVVDIGGGLGHDLEKFLKEFPESKGRLILQDQPHVIAKVHDLDAGIRTMVQDFLQPQAVEGARAYFLHQILHDWPDDKCRTILKHIKAAMRFDSRILINEMVVPSADASMNHTTFDMIMLAVSSGRERDEEAWHRLIDSAGLEIVKIWTNPVAADSVIECQIKVVPCKACQARARRVSAESSDSDES